MKFSNVLLVLLFIGVVLLFTIAPSEKELAKKLMEGNVKDDIEFISEILPCLCERDNEEFIYNIFQSNGYGELKNELGEEELKRKTEDLLHSFKQYLKNAVPNNLFQKELKSKWLTYLSEKKVFETEEEELEYLRDLSKILIEHEVREYFENLMDEISGQGNYKIWEAKVAISGNYKNGQYLNVLFDNFNKIANYDKEYKDAYESGCLRRLLTETKKYIQIKHKT